MALLALFAVIAGAATAVSPCVLPILPALLGAGATGGRRRPFGVVLGLAVTFTVTIVGLAEVAKGVGLGDSGLRDAAIAVLAAFGVAMVVPALAARLEAPLSRLARLGPRSTGDGFWSGLCVGAAFGFVYAPCAGPILAAVIAVSAASGSTVLVGLGYALGTALMLLVVSLLGRRVLRPLRGPGLQRALGAVMVLTAGAMALQLDVRFQEAIAVHWPAGLVNPARPLEDSHAVQARLDRLRGPSRYAKRPSGPAASLPDLGPAPEFADTQRWFNTPGGRPLTMAGLRGRVVLIDFWTYTCINCIRTLPYLNAWNARYRADGLTIVGVHSPEFPFEHDAGNVARAIRADHIAYPVVQDNDLATWDAWGNQYWPADYLVDARGRVRYAAFGEGDYDQTEAAIRALLADAGRAPSAARATPHGAIAPSGLTTPETYLGVERAQGVDPQPTLGTHDYDATPSDRLALSRFTIGGRWSIAQQGATAVRDATIGARVYAKDVYLVLSPAKHGRSTVRVTVDGRPAAPIHVTGQRLYTIASFRSADDHRIALRLDPGTSAFAFTFG
ncbi:MAG TPA: cytochrome c biogenesis protein DipZ [Solirubrobacteraceae bacterium]|nr:cytochrome c biogenesis protein DipZ [Solirubrobacteraceae bacterium]